jgi:DnaJ like chaperone protein
VFGKLFGGTFGFMVGGPLGALVGVAVGHNLDQGLWKASIGLSSDADDSSAQEVFFRTTFQLMGHIAKADGRVSELEIAAARTIMDHLRLNTDQRRAAMENFTAGKQPNFPVDASLETLRRAGANRANALQEMLQMQLNVAYADGSLHPRTHARLLDIATRIGLSRLQFETLHQFFRAQQQWSRQQHQYGNKRAENQSHSQNSHGPRPSTPIHSLEQAYQVLGLSREANPAEIKLAYRRLLKQYHPDKLPAETASAAEIKRATEKTREITAAYERIREARGL